MARKTDGEKIDELDRVTAVFGERIKQQRSDTERLAIKAQSHDQKIAEIERQLTLVQRDVEELRKSKEEFGRRLWAIAGPIAGALIGGVIGYFLHR